MNSEGNIIIHVLFKVGINVINPYYTKFFYNGRIFDINPKNKLKKILINSLFNF